jgi:creatinine amidohydrolase
MALALEGQTGGDFMMDQARLTHRPNAKPIEPMTKGDEQFREKFISWNLAECTYVEVREYLKEKDIILIPAASFEQHGPHLPLWTDTLSAVETSRRVSELIGVLHTPPIWMGYSPHHMHRPGEGRGTITLRTNTLFNLWYDVGRSLIHHGFNRLMFVNGHGSNLKIIDPVLRKLRYETGALIGLVNPWMERYTGILEGIMEGPADETPGWHAGEFETCQVLSTYPELVRWERANFTRAHVPEYLPKSFAKQDGAPDVAFEGYTYFRFPMEHHEFIETGVIGNPCRATAEKGEECFRRLSEHVARGVLDLMRVPVTVHDREWVDRAM